MLANLTKNSKGGVAFNTTKDKCIDFFFKLLRSSSPEKVLKDWEKAFKEDPKTALAVLYNFRDIRNGKGERNISYICMFWLKCKYPKLYNENLKNLIVDMGCWKDILFLYDLTNKYNKIAKTNLSNVSELDLLTKQLQEDFSGKPSLLIKWTPMENKRYHSIFLDIVKKLEMSPKQYRKKVTEARKSLNLVETNLSNNKEDQINFETVPAACHRIHRNAFKREENSKKVKNNARVKLAKRYEEYLQKLEKGEVKINFKGTQPHQLVDQFLNRNSPNATIEGQWKALVDDIKQKGSFGRSLAVVDVSGSMTWAKTSPKPLEVAIALGILTSECTQEPFSDYILTFHSDPKFIKLSGNLQNKVNVTKNAPWGGSTNLWKVFEMILATAVQNNVSQEKMVDKLFIFTDMEFDQAVDNNESIFKKAQQLFSEKGYTLPQVVCWNLNSTETVPVTSDIEGVCLLSGYSSELLKAILETKGPINPYIAFNMIIKNYEPVFSQESCIENNFSISLSNLDIALKKCKIKKKTK